jgi:tetratricopeptide (TPR) repeat protein
MESASVTHGLRPEQRSRIAGYQTDRAAASQAPARVPPARAASIPWLVRLSSWLEAVNEHRPGALDMPARLIGFWTDRDLEEVRTDLFALVASCARELNRTVRRPESIVCKHDVIDFDEVQRLLGLTDDELAHGDANRVLERAAILHADVAMLVIPMLPDRIGCSARGTVLVKDGNRIGMGCVGIHWIFGRILLDAVRQDRADKPIVRLWYHATLAHMLETGNYADAELHIEHGRVLFPSDPAILFEHGLYHEALAAPFLRAVALEAGSDGRDAKTHLAEADDLYRKAVKENPQFIEARVHRGYVLGQLGRHGEAAEELRLAVRAAQGSQLRYYSELFLGYAEESLGNRGAARDHYRQASALYPQAQSPLLALALLARQLGDRAAVQDAMRQMLALPAGRGEDGDPWLSYRRWQNQGSGTLFTELYAPYLDGGRR